MKQARRREPPSIPLILGVIGDGGGKIRTLAEFERRARALGARVESFRRGRGRAPGSYREEFEPRVTDSDGWQSWGSIPPGLTEPGELAYSAGLWVSAYVHPYGRVARFGRRIEVRASDAKAREVRRHRVWVWTRDQYAAWDVLRKGAAP